MTKVSPLMTAMGAAAATGEAPVQAPSTAASFDLTQPYAVFPVELSNYNSSSAFQVGPPYNSAPSDAGRIFAVRLVGRPDQAVQLQWDSIYKGSMPDVLNVNGTITAAFLYDGQVALLLGVAEWT